MPRKIARNPHLLVLLKRMLAYEFADVKPISDYEIANYIYDRHKSEEKIQSQYSDKSSKRDSYAYSKAERIYKILLNSTDVKYSNDILDHMVSEITKLGKFQNWDEFEVKFSNLPGVAIADRNYKDRTEISEKEFYTILSHVNLFLYKLHFKNIAFGDQNVHKIFSVSDGMVIRSSSEDEIAEIELLAKQVYPCPINDNSIKRPWYKKNPNIFFICKDENGLWANINLLPLKERSFYALKTGRIYENSIRPNDIYSPIEKDEVKYIYVEGFACVLNHLLPLFSFNLKKMIDCLANTSNSELIICAIGGSKEGDQLMRNSGFQVTGTAFDPKEDLHYPFFEIKWKDLEKRISVINDNSKAYVNNGGLTKNS